MLPGHFKGNDHLGFRAKSRFGRLVWFAQRSAARFLSGYCWNVVLLWNDGPRNSRRLGGQGN